MNNIFPFDTCEKVNKNGIAQPYSFGINIITCLIIINFYNKNNNILLLALLLFQMFHTFSHSIHIAGKSQTLIQHLLAYLVNIAFLYYLYKQTNILPNRIFLFLLFLLVLFDLYALKNLSLIYYFYTQIVVFALLYLFYLNKIPKLQNNFKLLFFFILIISLLALNEKNYCKHMLEKYPNFPFHILIEITGSIIFYLFCQNII
jgi:hypothetical protein